MTVCAIPLLFLECIDVIGTSSERFVPYVSKVFPMYNGGAEI